MSYETSNLYTKIEALEERIEELKSDNEDLKYHFLALLQDYAIVVSQEGYANKNDITELWMKKIKNL